MNFGVLLRVHAREKQFIAIDKSGEQQKVGAAHFMGNGNKIALVGCLYGDIRRNWVFKGMKRLQLSAAADKGGAARGKEDVLAGRAHIEVDAAEIAAVGAV